MGKRLTNIKKIIDSDKHYALDEAISFILVNYAQKYGAKFDETIEFVMKLGVDTKKSDQIVRGAVIMPNGLGVQKKVAAVVEADKLKELENIDVDFVGGEDLIQKIKEGFTDFDICVATPGMMPKITSIAKLLGPRGLMPNPKLGTVSDDIADLVKNIKNGYLEFKTDKKGVVHVGIAKISFKAQNIKENLIKLYEAVLLAKPAKSKGVYMQDLFLSCTQGPSLKLDLKSFVF